VALTKTFNKNKPEESLKDILYEWLTHNSCFGSLSVGVMVVTPYISTAQERLEVQRCEFDFINVMNQSPGAGRVGGGSVKRTDFRTMIVEIIFKASRTDAGGVDAELALIRNTDLLDKYFRSILGGAVLGQSGLRKAKLEGPFQNTNKIYYQRKFLLSFRIEV